MPTSSIVPQAVTNRQPTSLSFQTPPSFRPTDVLISPLSWCALQTENLSQGANIASTTYPASSRVLAYPFAIADYLMVVKVWWLNGATVGTDSCDVGVYNEAGTTLLVSGGSTLTAGANVVQEKDCTDTLLQPGRYWCAYVQGGVTATPHALLTTAANLRSMGCAQMAGSGSTLGATFTPAANASAFLNIFGISARTQVA